MSLGWKRQEETPPVEKSRAAGGEPAEAPELKTVEMFKPEVPQRRFEELVVTPKVRFRIEAALARVVHHETLYHQWNLKKIDPHRSGMAINLYGPPGTGKTFCAEAVAQHLCKTIIKINYAEIESKYVGETPKNITAAFNRARETGAVLFFDESDSILGKRLTSIAQSADHGVNVSRAVMLTQLDSFSGVVIFATNLVRNYDGAFVRRILAHIEFELPDEPCRRQLWSFLLPAELPCEPDVDPEWLAQVSEGLSGGDMLNVVVASASRAVSRDGANRRVQRGELIEEIAMVRRAKAAIGTDGEITPPPAESRVTVVRFEDLPEDLRDELEKVRITEPTPGSATPPPA
ncbi:MAG TPA: ATP-binding protein [Thermoanaerobaculia bacterium]|nr:ATP-binding protein [Thermoanaerobaculia bacterium]